MKNGHDNRPMIARVAEAIWNSNQPPGAPTYDSLTYQEQDIVEIIARAAIEAMRDLSPEMVVLSDPVEIDKLTRAWHSMIDAVLEEN